MHLELIILAAKDVRLAEIESKMTRLEESDIQQELLIKELRKEREFSSSNSEQSVGKSDMFFRTCGELHTADPSLASGMYWIDPDGQGIGDEPIYAYCDRTKGIAFLIPRI